MKRPVLLTILALGAAAVPRGAAAQPTATAAKEDAGARWSIALLGGAMVPVQEMRDGYQDGLVAGLRLGVRARVGIGVQLAVDYSPLPRRPTATETFDTTYGTVAMVPGWTFGRRTVRLQIGAGGGVALERTRVTGTTGDAESAYAPAAIGQVGLEVHVTRGGGLLLMTGATRTFGDREYQYAWGMGGLTLEF